MKALRIFSLTVLFLALSGAGASWAAQPLLMEGKKTLFQRVITHPGAMAYSGPQASSGKSITPFSIMYVYDRQENAGQKWVAVAPDTKGRSLSWVNAKYLSEWKQSLVLTFAERAGRSPVLFFKDARNLEDIAGQSGITGVLKKLAEDFQNYLQKSQDPPNDFPVTAMEPADEEGAVPYNHFYLMPIFSYQEPFEGVKFLEVGSIDPGGEEEPEADKKPEKKAPPKKTGSGELKNAIALVIDTTMSMGPYIDKTLQITRDIYDRLVADGQGDSLALGLVAFRNNFESDPEVEYTAKVISPLKKAMNRADLEKALAKVREAQVSTHSFSEDSLAGVKMAIDKLDWEEYQGRVIILITDAGPLPITDPYATTMLSLQGMADRAKKKNIRLVALHILTPAGAKAKNHNYAADAYKDLTGLGSAGSAYIPLPARSL